jgi:hypothetical protein
LKVTAIKLPVNKTIHIQGLCSTAFLLDIRIFQEKLETMAMTLWATPLPAKDSAGKDLTVHLLPFGEDIFLMPGTTLLAGQVIDRTESVIITEGVFK